VGHRSYWAPGLDEYLWYRHYHLLSSSSNIHRFDFYDNFDYLSY
jgi:hypothetical protein